MKKNKIAAIPPSGQIQIERFGSRIAGTEEQHTRMLQRAADQYPALVEEINDLVNSIVIAVQAFNPIRLLHASWSQMFILFQKIEVELDVGEQELNALRMIEYIQSIIAAAPSTSVYKEDFTKEDWESLSRQVIDLFYKINSEYLICATAKRKLYDPDFDMAMEEFYVKAQVHWCNVRGTNHQVHQIQSLADLLIPQSEFVERAFGITADMLIGELEKIWHSLTFGLGQAVITEKNLRIKALDIVQAQLESGTTTQGKNVPELIQIAMGHLGCQDEYERALGNIFDTNLFDVGMITNLPLAFLDEFSWEPGQDQEFLAAGEFRGWPLRILPTFKRPFLKVDGRYYCFDIHSLFDNFFRQIEKKIYLQSEAEKQGWIARRKIVSETLPIKYFEKLLPNAIIYREIYYQSQDKQGGPKKWCEADCLLLFDGHLFVIEVKAGAFTYTSPATDLPAYVSSLRSLVQAPVEQGQRFVNYLKSSIEVPIFDVSHNEIARLRYSDQRLITVCAISLDDFTEIAAQSQHLRKIGLPLGDDPIWALSLPNLRVYADIFQSPLEFLHFVEQRRLASTCEKLELDDELDHLGLYLEHNNYSLYAESMSTDTEERLVFRGYRSEVDKFFSKKLRSEISILPVQRMPLRLREILNFLNESSILGRSLVASFLLDLDGYFRHRIFFEWIEIELNELPQRGRCLPVSTHGNLRLTIFVNLEGFAQRSSSKAYEHAQIAMVSVGDSDRSLLELWYDKDKKLTNVQWSSISLKGLSDYEIDRLKKAGETLKETRIANAKAFGKIGRNQLCPCGSGKKFKRCCINVC